MLRACLLLALFCFLFAELQSLVADDESTPASRNLERQTFDLVNAYRSAHDLAALSWNGDITAMARQHSRDMASGVVDFGHEGFGDRMDKLKDLFTGMRGGGENVFESDNTQEIAQFAVANWLKSPPHLHNIRGDYTESGLGLWRSRTGVYYFTQIFVKIGD